MSQGLDTFRYRYGDSCPVQMAFDQTIGTNPTAFGISIGDLCWIDSADGFKVKPADCFAFNTSLSVTQVNFVGVFAGISGQRWDGQNLNAYGIKDGLLRIDTAGIFEMACAAASSFNAGDLVGPNLNGGNTFLLPQNVIAVAGKANAIGRVVQAVTNASSVLVEIFPAKFNIAFN